MWKHVPPFAPIQKLKLIFVIHGAWNVVCAQNNLVLREEQNLWYPFGRGLWMGYLDEAPLLQLSIL